MTAAALPVVLAAPLVASMQATPIAKPPKHGGPPELDMFDLSPKPVSHFKFNKKYLCAVRRELDCRAHKRLAAKLRSGQIEHLLVVWREFANSMGA